MEFNMNKIATCEGYDFYAGRYWDGIANWKGIYNIVPTNSPAPVTGYHSYLHIAKVKGIQWPLWWTDCIQWRSMSKEKKIQYALEYNRPDIADKYR